MYFFDHNATTPLHPDAKKAWLVASDEYWLNPSSPYRAGARVRVYLDQLRAELANICNVSPQRIVFNSGATEGNNMVFRHWLASTSSKRKVAVSPTEHPSVLEPARALFGKRLVFLSLRETGALDLDRFEEEIASGAIGAVSVMAANNETGVLNDWERVAKLCNRKNVSFHCDAAQWIGKLYCDTIGTCDFVTACGHKFGGPPGVGFMIIPEGLSLTQSGSLLGGAQEGGRRAGTEAVAAIAGMVAALRASMGLKQAKLRDEFETLLKTRMPQVKVVGAMSERLWNTTSVIMPEFASSRWIGLLERAGFLVSAGSACSTGKEGPSHVLSAMGMDSSAARRVLRISSGTATTRRDWLALADALSEVWALLRSEQAGSGSRVISI